MIPPGRIDLRKNTKKIILFLKILIFLKSQIYRNIILLGGKKAFPPHNGILIS